MRKQLWGFIKFLIATIFGAAILEFSHLLGWFPDRQLAELAMGAPSIVETRIFWVGLVAIIAIAALFAEHWLGVFNAALKRERSIGKSKLNIWGPWVLIVGGPILGFIWLMMLRGPTDGPKSTLNQQIKMDCSYEAFLKMPPSRLYWELIVGGSIPTTISFQQHQYAPDLAEQFIRFPKEGHKCTVTNYSGYPIFNVKATIKFQLQEAVREGAGMHGGAIIGSPSHEISIDKIEGAGQNFFEFFTWNYSDFFVYLEIPKTIELQRLGSEKRENVELIAPSRSFESLRPKDREFTTKTARQLLSLYENRTPLQADKLIAPDKQKWISLAAIVETILPEGERSIGVLKSDSDVIECRFGKYWKEKLSSLGKGDPIKVIGKISNNQNGSQLYLLDCEIVPN